MGKFYSTDGETGFFGFQMGKEAATAHFGDWIQVPSFLVVRVRKNLFVERFAGVADGSAL